MVFRTVPGWASNMADQLRDIVRETAREQDIYDLAEDSREIEDAIQTIRKRMEKIDRQTESSDKMTFTGKNNNEEHR